jgi:hypothetical protein
LILEECEVTFQYLPRKKNVVADALTFLDMDELKIPLDKVLKLYSESEDSSIKFPKHSSLMLKEQENIPGHTERNYPNLTALPSVLQRQDLHPSAIKTKSTILVS